MRGAGAEKYIRIQNGVKIHSPWPSDGLDSAWLITKNLCLNLCCFSEKQTNGSNIVKRKEIKWCDYFYWERQNIATLGGAKNTVECFFFFKKKEAVVAAQLLGDCKLTGECPWDHLLYCAPGKWSETLFSSPLRFLSPLQQRWPAETPQVFSHAAGFPWEKQRVSGVARSQSVWFSTKWINFQKLGSNWNWVIKRNKLNKLNRKGHYQVLLQNKKGSWAIQTWLVVMGKVARGNGDLYNLNFIIGFW